MAKIIIKPITTTSVKVGSKVVYCTMDTWVAVSELTPSETKAFHQYKQDCIDKDAPLETLIYKI